MLPADVTVPTAFETIGHIAHLNLRDEQLPYKQAIGQVLLEVQKRHRIGSLIRVSRENCRRTQR